jgi:putative ABC transport system permease protein
MMTGQILAGMDPLEAAKYQILLLFLLSGGAGLGAPAVTECRFACSLNFPKVKDD